MSKPLALPPSRSLAISSVDEVTIEAPGELSRPSARALTLSGRAVATFGSSSASEIPAFAMNPPSIHSWKRKDVV